MAQILSMIFVNDFLFLLTLLEVWTWALRCIKIKECSLLSYWPAGLFSGDDGLVCGLSWNNNLIVGYTLCHNASLMPLFLVYQLRAQNLTFVAPIPEHDGTLTMLTHKLKQREQRHETSTVTECGYIYFLWKWNSNCYCCQKDWPTAVLVINQQFATIICCQFVSRWTGIQSGGK